MSRASRMAERRDTLMRTDVLGLAVLALVIIVILAVLGVV